MGTMSTDEFHGEQGLRDLYYDPEGGYSSVEMLYQEAKKEGIPVTRKHVKEWLHEQEPYTKFKPLKKPKKYQRVFVKDLGEELQMDLVDMKKFKNENDNNYWILTAIEILSRYAFAVPVRRKDTENMTAAVEKVTKEFSERFGKLPTVVQFDEGKEFYNVGVRDLLRDYGVKYFSSQSERKASVVERLNRTLKTRMWKYFDHEKTKRWIDVLDEFVSGYNNTVHSSTKMKPEDVNEENKDVVFATLYGYGVRDLEKPKFKVGDRVRIYRYKTVFAKGFEANFTDEVFTVSRVYGGDPNMYEITDDENEPIVGKFYESEMVRYEGGKKIKRP